MKLLEQYAAVLLDLNGTFMFGEDRFGPEQDFFATYLAQGGRRLSAGAVTQAIRACYEGMLLDSRSPARFDDFPSLADGLRRYGGVAEEDLESLEAVFAAHELGSISSAHAGFLKRLATTHQLGLVSNIWSRKPPWLAEFARVGLADLFRVLVFSSDTRSIKPSPRLFQRALQVFPSEARMLFIGDSLQRDMAPAKSLGLDTAWISAARSSPLPDYTFSDLLEIEFG